jgi:hypothetical protein
MESSSRRDSATSTRDVCATRPERFDPETRARLSQAPIEEINQWKADSAAELATLWEKVHRRAD